MTEQLGATSRRKLHRALVTIGATVDTKDGELLVRTGHGTIRIGCRGHDVSPVLVRRVVIALGRDGMPITEFYRALYRRPKGTK